MIRLRDESILLGIEHAYSSAAICDEELRVAAPQVPPEVDLAVPVRSGARAGMGHRNHRVCHGVWCLLADSSASGQLGLAFPLSIAAALQHHVAIVKPSVSLLRSHQLQSSV